MNLRLENLDSIPLAALAGMLSEFTSICGDVTLKGGSTLSCVEIRSQDNPKPMASRVLRVVKLVSEHPYTRNNEVTEISWDAIDTILVN